MNANASIAGLLLAFALAGCVSPRGPGAVDRQTVQAHRLLARGVTLACLFDRPDDTKWIEMRRADVFREMRRTGFTAARVPVDFSTAQRIDDTDLLHPAWLERIERVVRQADRAGLAVVVVARMPGDLTTPEAQARLVADWGRLAQHLCEARECVYFELLDGPNGRLTDSAWSRLAEEIRLAIRESNPDRVLIVGPAQRYNPLHLAYLDLPPDPRLLFAFAYDEPAAFTHQGDPTRRGSDAWLGTAWSGTPEDIRRVEGDLDRVTQWAREHNRKLLCADFGATAKADPDSRVQWTFFVARALEERDIGWCYKELTGETGVFDPEWRIWRQPMLGALLNK
ncbi:MAG TPA: cellulase family glycosylhydrolase [Kiritimatiellia bacterium]|nr:cellulase family glycosylhydrolase [Kiritimatiellia bacterium]